MFLGQNKISSTKEDGDFVQIKFEDGTTEKLSKEQFDFLKSDESLNSSDYNHKRHLFLQKLVYDSLVKHNVTLQEINYLCQRLPLYIQDDLNHKITKMFKKEDENLQPKPLAEKLTLWDIF